MTPFISIINTIAGAGTVLLQIFAVVLLCYLIFCRNRPSKFMELVTKHAYLIGFLVSLGSMLLSLIYSDGIGFLPCMLCWYQRIFIYPLAFMFGLALIKKERSITDYALLLTIVGMLISLFHNYIYIFGEGSAPCDASGVSCVAHYVTFLGYISIPLMALTGFVVTLLVLIARKRNESR